MVKSSSGIRLSDDAKAIADREAQGLGISRTAFIELAIRMYGQLLETERLDRNSRGAALLGQALPAGHPQ